MNKQNYIRMYTEKSYYKAVDHDMVEETDEESKTHKGSSVKIYRTTCQQEPLPSNYSYLIDHCVENLRQRLMCMPDLQIYTYHWESNHELPFADLRTNHQCIDWSRFYEWAEEHAFHSATLHRPAGAEMLTEEDKWS